VLVLEKWGWFGGVLEYCAKSELHPRSGLGMLTRRIKIVLVLESGVGLAKCWRTTPSRNCTSRSGLTVLKGRQREVLTKNVSTKSAG
jgi:hypothetical protein